MQSALTREKVAILDIVAPAAATTGAKNGGWVSAADFAHFRAVFMAGILGSSATLDGKIQQATDSSGTGAKDLSPAKAITQLVKATDDGHAATIDFNEQDLDRTNGFCYVRTVMTVGTATSQCASMLMGSDAAFQPASSYETSAIVEKV